MKGALINAVGILIGGGLGLLLKKILPTRLNDPVMTAGGLGVSIMALLGIITTMVTVTDDGLKTSGELLLIISLVIGVLVGELLRIDDGLIKLSLKLESKIKGNGFSEGFISATMVFCIGALAIMGPLNEVLYGDLTVALFKALVDSLTAIMLAVTLGYGVLFSAIPVLVIQGSIALLGNTVANVPQQALNEVFMVGYAIVLCIGINFVFKTKIKTANMLPALIVPILYNLFI